MNVYSGYTVSDNKITLSGTNFLFLRHNALQDVLLWENIYFQGGDSNIAS